MPRDLHFPVIQSIMPAPPGLVYVEKHGTEGRVVGLALVTYPTDAHDDSPSVEPLYLSEGSVLVGRTSYDEGDVMTKAQAAERRRADAEPVTCTPAA